MISTVKHVLVDGTFKSVAKPFYQLFTVHSVITRSEEEPVIVPIIFALLPNKKEITYYRLFSLLREHFPNFKPDVFQSDYEVGIMNAAKVVFPEIDIRGCLFHYSQNLWKKAKRLGLTNKAQKKEVAYYVSIAYLPLHYFPEAVMTIKNISMNDERITLFHDYFVQQWLKPNIMPTICFTARDTAQQIQSKGGTIV